MTKRVIAQVKYCKTNEELNVFLKTLYTDGDENHYPKLKNILYIENTQKNVQNNPMIRPTEHMDCVIAIVETLDVTYTKDENDIKVMN